MRVYDSVYPDNYDEEVLTISVNRNLNAPVILELGNLATTIWDTHPIGDLVIDVNATDADNVSTHITVLKLVLQLQSQLFKHKAFFFFSLSTSFVSKKLLDMVLSYTNIFLLHYTQLL